MPSGQSGFTFGMLATSTTHLAESSDQIKDGGHLYTGAMVFERVSEVLGISGYRALLSKTECCLAAKKAGSDQSLLKI